jgi:hypothetical protein
VLLGKWQLPIARITRDTYIHLAGKVQFLMSKQAVHEIANELESCEGVREGTVGSGTGLPAGRSWVRFPINLILLAFLWSVSNRNVYQGFLLGVKATNPTTLPPSCADCLEFWKPQPPEALRACSGLYRESLMIYVLSEKNMEKL